MIQNSFRYLLTTAEGNPSDQPSAADLVSLYFRTLLLGLICSAVFLVTFALSDGLFDWPSSVGPPQVSSFEPAIAATLFLFFSSTAWALWARILIRLGRMVNARTRNLFTRIGVAPIPLFIALSMIAATNYVVFDVTLRTTRNHYVKYEDLAALMASVNAFISLSIIAKGQSGPLWPKKQNESHPVVKGFRGDS